MYSTRLRWMTRQRSLASSRHSFRQGLKDRRLRRLFLHICNIKARGRPRLCNPFICRTSFGRCKPYFLVCFTQAHTLTDRQGQLRNWSHGCTVFEALLSLSGRILSQRLSGLRIQDGVHVERLASFPKQRPLRETRAVAVAFGGLP